MAIRAKCWCQCGQAVHVFLPTGAELQVLEEAEAELARQEAESVDAVFVDSGRAATCPKCGVTTNWLAFLVDLAKAELARRLLREQDDEGDQEDNEREE